MVSGVAANHGRSVHRGGGSDARIRAMARSVGRGMMIGELLTVAEFAVRYSVSETAVKRLMRDPRLAEMVKEGKLSNSAWVRALAYGPPRDGAPDPGGRVQRSSEPADGHGPAAANRSHGERSPPLFRNPSHHR